MKLCTRVHSPLGPLVTSIETGDMALGTGVFTKKTASFPSNSMNNFKMTEIHMKQIVRHSTFNILYRCWWAHASPVFKHQEDELHYSMALHIHTASSSLWQLARLMSLKNLRLPCLGTLFGFLYPHNTHGFWQQVPKVLGVLIKSGLELPRNPLVCQRHLRSQATSESDMFNRQSSKSFHLDVKWTYFLNLKEKASPAHLHHNASGKHLEENKYLKHRWKTMSR